MSPAPSGRARCLAGGAAGAAGADGPLADGTCWVAKSWMLYTTWRTDGRWQAAGWMLPPRQMKFCERAYSKIARHPAGNFQKEVFQNDQEIHLTKNEYRLLKCLFEQIGKVVTYQTLMTQVWGPYSEDSQILRVNMSNIRKKIETNTLKPEYIITEIGVGYRLRDYRS